MATLPAMDRRPRKVEKAGTGKEREKENPREKDPAMTSKGNKVSNPIGKIVAGTHGKAGLEGPKAAAPTLEKVRPRHRGSTPMAIGGMAGGAGEEPNIPPTN